MTSGVDIVGLGSGVSSLATATPASSSAAAPAVEAATTAADAKQLTVLHNPRVINDPVAGFITQYLSTDGSEIISQSPSAVTVAYLRMGLMGNGMPKEPMGSTIQA